MDIRSDLYSLGVTLWNMLAGQPPFRGTSAELMHQHLHAGLPIGQLDRLPQPVVALIELLLGKDPARRFQNPAELLRALPSVTRAIEAKRTIKHQNLRVTFVRQKELPAIRAPKRSIAVLPFETLDQVKGKTYFADGVQDEILSNLAKVSLFALRGPMNRCQQGELTKVVFECPQAKIIKSWHEHVQKYFLETDPKTLACEIPIWAVPEEDPILEELIPIENIHPFPTLTGHIDLIRFSERLLWIWDYKPNAAAERFPSQQVYLYARMLACRTGIPLNSFRCGYFDHGLEVTFDPM